eukprot:1159492-Pelagomonas_calceolata.AAC.4
MLRDMLKHDARNQQAPQMIDECSGTDPAFPSAAYSRGSWNTKGSVKALWPGSRGKRLEVWI